MFMWDQIAIAVFGVTAVYLTQVDNKHLNRYACLFGLAAQPFWFYASAQTQQWGIFAISMLYTLVWFKGFMRYWLQAPPTN